MQALQRSTRPFTATRAAPRPAGRAAVARQQLSARRHDRIVAAAVATADDIEDLEDDELLTTAASSVPAGALPSGKVKLRIRMRGYDIGILADACDQVVDIAALTGAKVAGPVNLPTQKKIYCVLRSPHVDKDSREHFEVRIHHRLVDLSNLSAQTVQALMEWVPPSGLEVESSIA